MRVLPVGETGLLVELDDARGGVGPGPALDDHEAAVAAAFAVLALHRVLIADPARPAVVTDLVPAARTLLVHVEPRPGAIAAVTAWLRGHAEPGPAPVADPVADPMAAPLTIPVVYDGQDLADVAELAGLSVPELVAAHAARAWTVAFTGFAPGFGYLVGGDSRLRVPRLATPRTRVPAGAVALAGPYCGVYPRPTPGGWRLIGRTDLAVWDVGSDPPALLRPGRLVRFEPVRTRA